MDQLLYLAPFLALEDLYGHFIKAILPQSSASLAKTAATALNELHQHGYASAAVCANHLGR